jgi:hypothetical protein
MAKEEAMRCGDWEIDDYDDDSTDCANCGGEGFAYGCSWDWQCDTYDEGEGTCLCTRRCEWCNPPKPTPESEALRQVLAAALAQPEDQS